MKRNAQNSAVYERREGKARSTCQAFVDTYDLQRNKLCSITGISWML